LIKLLKLMRKFAVLFLNFRFQLLNSSRNDSCEGESMVTIGGMNPECHGQLT